MEKKIRPFENLDIIDNFMATAAASDPVVGKDFSRALVEGLLQVKLEDNIRVNIERTLLGDTPQKRGIRMDMDTCFIRYEIDVMKCQRCHTRMGCSFCILIPQVHVEEMKS